MYKCTNVHTAPKKRESFFLKTLITDLFAAIDFFCKAKLKNGYWLVPQKFFNPYLETSFSENFVIKVLLWT